MLYLSPVLVTASVLICLVAIGWAAALFLKFRDLRIGFLAAMLLALLAPQIVTIAHIIGLPALVESEVLLLRVPVSILALLAVVFLGQFLVDRRRVEKALVEREQFLRSIIDNEPECVKLLAVDGTLLEMNRAGLEMVEAESGEQVVGHCVYPIVAPEYREKYRSLIERVFRGESGQLEFEIVGLKGSRRWLETHASPLRDAAGTVTALLSITRDVTKRRQAEVSLRRSQEHLAALINSVDGIVWEVDAKSFQFTFVSPRAERLLGYPLSRWMNEPTFWADHVHPDDRAEAVRFCQESTRNQRDHVFEYRMLAADGREVWLRDIVTVIAENDEAVTLRGIMVDITERRSADLALLESERRFREVYENSRDAIFVEAFDGQLLDVNPAACRLHGLTREQLLSKNVRDLVPADQRDVIARDFAKLYRGELTRTEGVSLRADGSAVPVELSVSRILFNDQPALLLHVRDITERKRVQDALRASEERYRLLFERNLAGVFQSTPAGKIIDCNEAFVQMFGYDSKAEVLASRAEDFYLPGSRQHYLKALVSERTLTGYESQLKRKDGTLIWGYENVAILPLGPNGEESIQGTIVDFTEFKRIENALRNSEARLEAAQARAKVGDWIRDVRNLSGIWSKQMYRMFNRDPKLDPPDFHELLELIHPDDRHGLIDRVSQATSLGQPPTAVEYRSNPDHGPVRWFHSFPEAIFDDDGNITHLAGTLIDITEVKLAEQAIRSSEKRLRAVVEQAPDGLFVCEPDARISETNPAGCAMSGYSREELLQLHVLDLCPEFEHAAVLDFIARVRAGQAGVEERILLRKDQTMLPCEVSAQLMHDERILGFVRDITGRKRAEQEQERLNREIAASRQRLEHLSRRVLEVQESERRSLARELHDEIGQVLSAISVNLKIASTKVDPGALPRMQESIGMVDRAVEQVRNLSLDLRPAVLDDFGLEAALRWYAQSQAERAGFVVHLNAAPAVAEPPNDLRNACFRIAQEALTNVVRHAGASQVWIELQQDEQGLRLSIRDNGQGFDEAAARQRVSRGVSLGLLSMRERAELLGGQVEIHGLPGRGTTVTVRFPVDSLDETFI